MIHQLRCVHVSTSVSSCICRCASCAVSVVSAITVTGRLIGAVAPIYLEQAECRCMIVYLAHKVRSRHPVPE